MKINSILVRAIIKTFKITDYELSVYFKHDIPAYQSCLEINHEYMMDASILFTLLERLKLNILIRNHFMRYCIN